MSAGGRALEQHQARFTTWAGYSAWEMNRNSLPKSNEWQGYLSANARLTPCTTNSTAIASSTIPMIRVTTRVPVTPSR